MERCLACEAGGVATRGALPRLRGRRGRHPWSAPRLRGRKRGRHPWSAPRLRGRKGSPPVERASLARPWLAREFRAARLIFGSALFATSGSSHTRAQLDHTHSTSPALLTIGLASEAALHGRLLPSRRQNLSSHFPKPDPIPIPLGITGQNHGITVLQERASFTSR